MEEVIGGHGGAFIGSFVLEHFVFNGPPAVIGADAIDPGTIALFFPSVPNDVARKQVHAGHDATRLRTEELAEAIAIKGDATADGILGGVAILQTIRGKDAW